MQNNQLVKDFQISLGIIKQVSESLDLTPKDHKTIDKLTKKIMDIIDLLDSQDSTFNSEFFEQQSRLVEEIIIPRLVKNTNI